MNKNKLILELELTPNEFAQLCKNAELDVKNEYSDEEIDRLKNHALGYDTSAIAVGDNYNQSGLVTQLEDYLQAVSTKYSEDGSLLESHLIELNRQVNQAYSELLPKTLDKLNLPTLKQIAEKKIEYPKLELP